MTKVDMIVDLQFGSTGKGLIAGVLAKQVRYDAVVTANMPNAGHTYIDEDGRKWVHKVLPNGIVGRPNRIMIGPGAVFDLARLELELHESQDIIAPSSTLVIHEAAAVLADRHRQAEKDSLNGIASTMQGSMAAMVEKMLRNDVQPILARHYYSDIMAMTDRLGIRTQIVDNYEWAVMILSSGRVLAEGAQGYSLGINAGMWPFCTSRDCTPNRFLSDMGIPAKVDLTVIGSARTYPIRVGNTPGGYSGPGYDDQHELSWSDIGQEPELTTVTKRERRLFTFSENQIREAVTVAQPDFVFLNFCNYLATPDIDIRHIRSVLREHDSDLGWTGWGPGHNDVRCVLPYEWY